MALSRDEILSSWHDDERVDELVFVDESMLNVDVFVRTYGSAVNKMARDIQRVAELRITEPEVSPEARMLAQVSAVNLYALMSLHFAMSRCAAMYGREALAWYSRAVARSAPDAQIMLWSDPAIEGQAISSKNDVRYAADALKKLANELSGSPNRLRVFSNRGRIFSGLGAIAERSHYGSGLVPLLSLPEPGGMEVGYEVVSPQAMMSTDGHHLGGYLHGARLSLVSLMAQCALVASREIGEAFYSRSFLSERAAEGGASCGGAVLDHFAEFVSLQTSPSSPGGIICATGSVESYYVYTKLHGPIEGGPVFVDEVHKAPSRPRPSPFNVELSILARMAEGGVSPNTERSVSRTSQRLRESASRMIRRFSQAHGYSRNGDVTEFFMDDGHNITVSDSELRRVIADAGGDYGMDLSDLIERLMNSREREAYYEAARTHQMSVTATPVYPSVDFSRIGGVGAAQIQHDEAQAFRVSPSQTLRDSGEHITPAGSAGDRSLAARGFGDRYSMSDAEMRSVNDLESALMRGIERELREAVAKNTGSDQMSWDGQPTPASSELMRDGMVAGMGDALKDRVGNPSIMTRAIDGLYVDIPPSAIGG